MEGRVSVVEKQGAPVEEVAVLVLRTFHSSAELTSEAKSRLSERIHFSKFPFLFYTVNFLQIEIKIT